MMTKKTFQADKMITKFKWLRQDNNEGEVQKRLTERGKLD
jgi:hypothetical protein